MVTPIPCPQLPWLHYGRVGPGGVRGIGAVRDGVRGGEEAEIDVVRATAAWEELAGEPGVPGVGYVEAS